MLTNTDLKHCNPEREMPMLDCCFSPVDPIVLFALTLVGNLVLLVGVKAALVVASSSRRALLCPHSVRRRLRRILRCCCLLRKVLLVCRQEEWLLLECLAVKNK